MKAKKQIKKLKESLSEQRSLLKEIHHEIFKDKKFSIGKPFDSKELTFEGTGSLSKDLLRSITEPKSSVEEKPFVLPEKWCILVTEENVELLNNYLKNNKDKYLEYSRNWKVIYAPSFTDYFMSERLHNGGHTITDKPNGYTEITFEQFFEHVVNGSTEPQSVSTEVVC